MYVIMRGLAHFFKTKLNNLAYFASTELNFPLLALKNALKRKNNNEADTTIAGPAGISQFSEE